jgi:hypothetical protein
MGHFVLSLWKEEEEGRKYPALRAIITGKVGDHDQVVLNFLIWWEHHCRGKIVTKCSRLSIDIRLICQMPTII